MPTQRGFSLKRWNDCWEKCKCRTSERDRKLHLSGVIIFSLLQEIRNELDTLYREQAPDIDNTQLLLAYISLSNRDRAIMSSEPRTKNKNIHSATISKNVIGNEITLQEVSDGAVDGLEKAIYFCKTRENNSHRICKGKTPLTVIEFIEKESLLSQTYGIYESYWHAILWSNYDLIEVDKENKFYIIEQPSDEVEIGLCVSQIRKSRLEAQSAMFATSPETLNFFDKDKYITYTKIGRNTKLSSKNIEKSDDEIKYINSCWKLQSMFLPDNFGHEILGRQTDVGFSINEALEIFRYLIILSIESTKKFPNNFRFSSLKEIHKFCPKVDKIELKRAISKSSGMTVFKVKKVLDFLEYKAYPKQDLWCHPIVSASAQKYALVTSSLVTPVILRLVEHWLVYLGYELQDKGYAYENLIIEGLNKALEKNSYILDFDNAVSRKITFNKVEEEIDLFFRIGDLIVIGEAKSIVTTDSPISNYRTVETLKHAAKQIKRKIGFVEKNIENVFNNLNWDYDQNANYKIIGCIINSGSMHVGSNIEGIPICDEKILLKYFQENKVPLLSAFDEKTREPRHLAWLTLYSNFDQLKDNLRTYLSNPPQIFERKEHFEYKQITLPYISEKSYKIVINRLVPIDLAANDRVNIKHFFPVGKVANYDEELEKVDLIV